MEQYENYFKENYLIKTKQQMANELNLTYHQVDCRLRKLKLRRHSNNKWTDEEIKILKEYYPLQTSKEEMLKLLPNHRWTGIQKQASKLGCIREWEYTYISVQGYLINCKDRNNKKEIHRQIYEQYYNVKLTSSDIIHHIDGNKLNNDPKNLIRLTRAEHVRLHKPRVKR